MNKFYISIDPGSFVELSEAEAYQELADFRALNPYYEVVHGHRESGYYYEVVFESGDRENYLWLVEIDEDVASKTGLQSSRQLLADPVVYLKIIDEGFLTYAKNKAIGLAQEFEIESLKTKTELG